MVKSRLIHLILGLALIFTLAGGIFATQSAVFAQTPTTTPPATVTSTPTPTTTPTVPATPTPTNTSIPAPTSTGTPDQLRLESTYPSLSADSGQTFNFNVDIKYNGSRQLFNISAAAPQGWDISFNNSAGKTITGVQLGPVDYTLTETLTINMSPALGQQPVPGDYPLAITVSSGPLTQTINLKATVKAKYGFTLSTDSGALNAKAVAGKENHTSIQIVNSGSASIDKLALTATKPDGWIITFNPSTVDSIGAGQTKQVDVTINPPGGNTVAGDYQISITANNGALSQSMDIRVTVATPTIWGWVGIIIVIAVIGGLAVLFMKLGRR